uniref:hypothetical protein n=1 Tax=Arachnia propionica TaxID=1750 RepID=UPI003C6F4C13
GVTIDGSTVTIIRRATGSIEILLGGESAGTVSVNQYATGMGSGPGGGQSGADQQSSRPGK